MSETLLHFIGRFHPLLIHLPIGILVAVVIMEFCLWGEQAKVVRPILRRFMLSLALVSALASVATGLLLVQEGGYSGNTVELHKWLGIAMTATLALVAYTVWKGQSLLGLYRVSLGICFILLSLGAHQGAVMTHGRDYLTEYWPFGGEAEEPGAFSAEMVAWQEGDPWQFALHILPIMEAKCNDCHGADKQRGELRLDTLAFIEAGSEFGPAVVPGDPENSPMYYLTTYHPSDDQYMPKRGEGLTPEEQQLLYEWIAQGANMEVIVAAPEPALAAAETEMEESAFNFVEPARMYATVADVPSVAPTKGEDWVVPNAGVELVWIEPGSFVMGSPEDEPGREISERQHTVTLTQGFWLGRYEVTQAEWERVMGTDPATLRDDFNKSWPIFQTGDDYPMYYVSRQDAKEFCARLTEQERAAGRLPEGYMFSLPTEAQWEYACRAGTDAIYYANAGLNDMAWYLDNTHGIKPVGQKRPNNWGLYDMHGNVWEWCFDTYLQYADTAVTDPVKVHWMKSKVVRGGSWRSEALSLRAAYRHAAIDTARNGGIGFRLALIPNVREWRRGDPPG